MIKISSRRASLRRPIKRAGKRLTLMGLDPTIRIDAKDGWLFIPLAQIVKLIDSKVAFTNKEVTIVEDTLVIHIWKGKKTSDDLEVV